MLYEVCKHIRNFFVVKDKSKWLSGIITIKDGVVDGLQIANGQYFLIEGSNFNDGIWNSGKKPVIDEAFDGVVYPLAIPSDFLHLVTEIEDYNTKISNAGIYQSESFGGYSYSVARTSGGAAVPWTEQYKTRLNAWRKL